ncbi:MAG: 2-C-methyl-D-erythritol 4-phosphate cytidylyltransferase [Actinomycetota bacterium]|nr:2-C-methyl-D-erythritol 4-phosphate cytidylyltransferase [Actinomycetota bacterium]
MRPARAGSDSVGALVPAAGLGVRLGPGEPKALRELAGEPLLVHAVRTLRSVPSIGVVVVAAPAPDVEAVGRLLVAYDVVVVPGGDDRQDSVHRTLAALPPDVDLVLVHDAARCLTPGHVIEAVVAALRAGADAVVPVLPIADTVKHVEGVRVLGTVDRAALRAVQTPQGFRREVLEQAHAAGRQAATDDASLVEVLGGTVTTVPGDDEAFKITRPLDLLLAEAVLAARSSRSGRHAR